MKLLKKKEYYAFYIALVLAVIFVALLVYDVINCRDQNIQVYNKQMQSTVEDYITMAKQKPDIALEEELVNCIKSNFETSASVYCIVAVDGKIIFVKDAATTKQLKDNSYEKYINSDNNSDMTFITELEDGKEYIVSTTNSVNNGKHIVFSIVSRKEYIEKQGKFDLLIQHITLYAVLFGIACITIAFFQLVEKRKLVKQIEGLKGEAQENRIQIQNLETEKLRVQEMEMNDKNCGFMSKKTMLAIFDLLTPEQKKNSYKIKIHTSNDDELLKVAVLLDRTNNKGCISCLWEEDNFLAVLLNGKKEDAVEFVKHIYNSFEQDYQESAPELEIKASPFLED